MEEIRGIDVMVSAKIGEVYTAVGGQRGATLNRASETIDVSNKVSGDWKKSITGLKEWSVDADGLLMTSDAAYEALETAFMEGTPVDLQIGIGADLTYSGEAIITDFPIEAPYDDVATYSVSFTGSGALIKA